MTPLPSIGEVPSEVQPFHISVSGCHGWSWLEYHGLGNLAPDMGEEFVDWGIADVEYLEKQFDRDTVRGSVVNLAAILNLA